MKLFVTPKVQSARNCRVEEEPGGSSPSAAGQIYGLRTKPCVAQWAPGS